MTKSELIKALENYEDDTEVVFTLECDNDFRRIENVRFSIGAEVIVLESYEIPTADDLYYMAKECLEEHRKSMSEKDERILEEFVGGK